MNKYGSTRAKTKQPSVKAWIKRSYNPGIIEINWQKRWEEKKLYQAEDFSPKPKKYILIEFPYPSGERLHVGHGRSYTALDSLSRKYRMQGFNVLYPVGWDAFGLPAENYAIKTGINPAITTEKNIENAKTQAKRWGLSFDWSREVKTTDPDYYKWTQWIFLKMLEKGLAYRGEVPVNWCPFCKTNLADEEVLADGTHERCGNKTERRLQRQWILKITAYAERLLSDLSKVNYLPQIALQQINWIGRSEGINLKHKVKDMNLEFEVFDSIPQTFMAQTFVVIAPEHPLVKKLVEGTMYEKPVMDFVEKMRLKKLSKGFDIEKEVDGIFTGRYSENYMGTGRDLPIWVASFVLLDYGTGIVGSSAHDARDFAFAKKYNLPLKPVLFPKDKTLAEKVRRLEFKYLEPDGILEEPKEFKGIRWDQAREGIINYIVEKGFGRKIVNYHLRDWVFSRQHYWGEPIPIVYCANLKEHTRNLHSSINGVDYAIIPVPEDKLPVELPYVENYKPIGTGESPLAAVSDWVNTTCPICGGPAKRETDTMPNWAGSNWYYVGYLIAKKLKEYGKGKLKSHNIFNESKDVIDYWMPVDLYNGGMEHTTLHLLYSRFVYKFLYDLGVVPTSEPYSRRHSHGVVLGPDGQKMSKSRGNVINPDDVIKAYGADTFRLYEMFMGPFEQMIAWNDEGVMGCHRFLKRIWQLSLTKVRELKTPPEIEIVLNRTIKKVTDDLEALKFNTAIASMMEFINIWAKPGNFLNKKDGKRFLQILAPFAPFIAEELWSKLGGKFSIHLSSWPKYNEKLIEETEVHMIVEINGKVRDKLVFKAPASKLQNEVEKLAKESEKIKKYLSGKKINQVIFVPGKLINFVIK